MYIAEQTLNMLNESLEKDQGSAYRTTLKNCLMNLVDPYAATEDPFRSHLGASMLGGKCYRAIWYSFRWVKAANFEGRILRLFNRGHLEEGRIIALLKSAGVELWSAQPDGKQFRVSYAGGHMGGSLDGVGRGIPELGNNPFLLEYKTHSDKSFTQLTTQGVAMAKPEHYVQCQTYMHGMKLGYTLYIGVNKNNDHIHAEILVFDDAFISEKLAIGSDIVYSQVPPDKLNKSPGWFECRYCDFVNICHNGVAPDKNCRTCLNSCPEPNGTWVCKLTGEILDKQKQLTGCNDYGRLI